MTPAVIAWECAYVLSTEHVHALTPAQHVLCAVAAMGAIEPAPVELIARAVQVLGRRQ